ncbi:uncharacterized protein [Miscanthus floridulus]|uniref:uncharacterized protein n=1 Tax=Miscanthus floridulus TaxID=154761 RepID=UPI00345AA1B8
MASAPVAGINDHDADNKAGNVVVKSEPVDMEHGEDGVIQPAVPPCGDPVLASVSFGDERGDSTECSSSFGDSGFGSDDDTESDTGVSKVDSPFFPHINVGDSTAMPHIIRKQKVTADWRKFIGPKRWRCHWLELHIKDLLSQVAKYDKELALVNHEKYLQLEMIKADSHKSELSHLDLSSNERNTIIWRKRTRYEDYMDTSLYIKNHQKFSYYNHENRKSRTGNEMSGADNELLVLSLILNADSEDTKSSFGMNDTLLDSNGNDTLLEQHSSREILLAVECFQSHIINLKSYLREAYNKTDHTQKSRKKKDLNGFHKMKNVGRPFGEGGDEITAEMLFGVNNPLINPHIERICKESIDDILIDNQHAAIDEVWQFERVKRMDETRSEPIKYVAEAPAEDEKLVNKRGPKPNKSNKKLGSSWSIEDQIKRAMKKNKEAVVSYPNTANNMFVAVDTRKSQRIRKPKIYLSK